MRRTNNQPLTASAIENKVYNIPLPVYYIRVPKCVETHGDDPEMQRVKLEITYLVMRGENRLWE